MGILDKEIKEILKEHLTVLQNAAKKQCSGTELKAITEAMVSVVTLYSSDMTDL